MKANYIKNRVYLEIEYDKYEEMVIKFANEILDRRNDDKEFTIDEDNVYVIKQLYYYLTGSGKFNGNLHKGIMLNGFYGTGKTVILESFCKLINEFTKKRITILTAEKYTELLPEFGLTHFENKPIFLDDPGKEQKEINHFGTILKPVSDLLCRKYDNGTWMLLTSNNHLKTFEKIYSPMVADKMRGMFNVFELKGGSRR